VGRGVGGGSEVQKRGPGAPQKGTRGGGGGAKQEGGSAHPLLQTRRGHTCIMGQCAKRQRGEASRHPQMAH